MKKTRLSSLKNKKLIIGMIVLLTIIAGISVKNYQDMRTAQQLTNQLTEKNKELNLLKEQLSGSQNEEKGFLAENLQTETLKSMSEELKKLEKDGQAISEKANHETIKKYQASIEACKTLLQEIETKHQTQNEVNALFELEKGEVAINGESIHTDLPIAQHFETVPKLKEKYYIDQPQNEWEHAINKLLIQAENQVNDIQTVKTKIEAFFTDKEDTADPNPEEFQTVKQDVEKIKNKKIKEELSKKIAQIQQKIDENTEKETQEKAEEAQVNTNDQAPVTNTPVETAGQPSGQNPEQNVTQNPNTNQNTTQGSKQEPVEQHGQGGSGQQNPAPSNPVPPTGPPAPNAFATHEEATAYGRANFNVNGYYIITFEGWYYVYSN